jgi:hypothetical protein
MLWRPSSVVSSRRTKDLGALPGSFAGHGGLAKELTTCRETSVVTAGCSEVDSASTEYRRLKLAQDAPWTLIASMRSPEP